MPSVRAVVHHQPFASAPEDSESSGSSEFGATGTPRQAPPVCLEGTLLLRKCRTSDNLKSWRYAYVILDMTNGGALSCYKQKPPNSSLSDAWLQAPTTIPSNNNHNNNNNNQKNPRNWFRRQKKNKIPSTMSSRHVGEDTDTQPRIHLPAHVNWIAKDIQNNPSGFVIEIPSDEPLLPYFSSEPQDGGMFDPDLYSQSSYHSSDASEQQLALPEDLANDVNRASEKGQNFRIYFKCSRTANEKVLWLRAFEQTERLSMDLYRQSGVVRNLFANSALIMSHSRVRTAMGQRFAQEGRVLDDQSEVPHSDDSFHENASIHEDPVVNLRMRTNSKGMNCVKEYLVYPHYAYPNRWMTNAELYAEMMKPSTTFHDLRLKNPNAEAEKREIGTLKVELLQCVGLPALDFASETDAVAYMVCGSYAFASDVIWNRLNPMWLARTRRACIFPLFHAYARLFVGIFDDDGKGEKDDYAGRVVLDVASLRPNTTYDVMMPLRQSGHVYSRQPRGSVRLRFSVHYRSEREAVLSYLPKSFNLMAPKRPEDDVTVICGDEKAFRNVAITVHGLHLPGRFSMDKWKATMREVNFVRKVTMNILRDLIVEIVLWKNPAVSALVFAAWMHSSYRGKFSLVPLYSVSFVLLLMIRTYFFYGSDGPVQNGLIPPSWEELFTALVRGGNTPRIEPLKLKPRRLPTRKGGWPVDVQPQTHKQRGRWLFALLGFKNCLDEGARPEEYQMEFSYSQGLKDPVTGKTLYPQFTVKESLVPKSSLMSRSKRKDSVPDLDTDNLLQDVMAPPAPKKLPQRMTMDFLSRTGKKERKKTERRKSYPSPDAVSSLLPILPGVSSHSVLRGNALAGSSHHKREDIPSRLQFPEQNADAKERTTKLKLNEELVVLRDRVHQVTGNAFNDRTHIVRRKDATYFGHKVGRVEAELERLLNTGQYSSPNPVVARVGLYVEPLISAVHDGLALARSLYNIVTWRDPIMSFWVSLLLLAIVLILAVFPWRLFFLATGCVVVGPQNYIIRVMNERGSTPSFVTNWFARRKETKEAKEDQLRERSRDVDVPKDQPVLTCHTSDNSPPLRLSMNDVHPRDVHEVSVPYSQFMYHRMYDWPPEPEYTRCEPTKMMPGMAAVRRTGISMSSHGNLVRSHSMLPGDTGPLRGRSFTGGSVVHSGSFS